MIGLTFSVMSFGVMVGCDELVKVRFESNGVFGLREDLFFICGLAYGAFEPFHLFLPCCLAFDSSCPSDA